MQNLHTSILPDSATARATVARHPRYNEIKEWVDSNWDEDLSKEWDKTRDVAIEWYLKDMVAFERQREDLERRKGARAKEQEQLGVDAVSVADADPEAQVVWEAVKAEMVEDVSEGAWDAWIAPTKGYSFADGLMVVMVGSAFGVEWLERKMHPTIVEVAQRVIGRPVDVRFVVGADGPSV